MFASNAWELFNPCRHAKFAPLSMMFWQYTCHKGRPDRSFAIDSVLERKSGAKPDSRLCIIVGLRRHTGGSHGGYARLQE